MASKSKSGWTKEERENFLKEHGFMWSSTGKGSHESWENPELKILVQLKGIYAPENLKSNTGQKTWEITIPCNPAGGTWKAIQKFVEWGKKTIDEVKSKSSIEEQRLKLVGQFYKAAKDTRAWRQAVKHHYKAGLDMARAPEAPISYDRLKDLERKKKEFSNPPI